MAHNIRHFVKKHRLSLLAGLAAVTYNNWLLGPLLNQDLFKHNGSISEYSVVSQPSHWVFQSLDIVSGIAFIIIGYSLWRRISRSRSGRFLAIGIGVLGAANIFDAIFSLPCSETLSPRCSIPINLSRAHLQLPEHAFSSVVIGVCYLLLPAAALAYALRRRLSPMAGLSLLLIANSLWSLASAIDGYIRAGAPTTKTSGSGQEIQMLVVGIWLITCLLAVQKSSRPADSKSR